MFNALRNLLQNMRRGPSPSVEPSLETRATFKQHELLRAYREGRPLRNLDGKAGI